MQQHTINHSITLQGIGLHLGMHVEMRLLPGKVDQGIIFRRIDLPKIYDIKVNPFNITETLMCTSITLPGVISTTISTIEHLMSALCIWEVDNVIIEVNGPEIPIMDGSSISFVEALKKTGTKQQNKKRQVVKILKPICVKENEKFAEVLPSVKTHYHFKIEWGHPVISRTPSEIDFSGEPQEYEETIAKARTFGFMNQIEYLRSKNLATGASLENTIGITNDGIANPAGLRYPDEFVKHKLLDAIGDFYVGGKIIGYFNCYKSGHNLNNRLLREVFCNKNAWKYL